MEGGGFFLADEISLADDSVLERINSVLEPERSLLLAEKGDPTPRLITAHPNFRFLATMNPGGDYGKKEVRAATPPLHTHKPLPHAPSRPPFSLPSSRRP